MTDAPVTAIPPAASAPAQDEAQPEAAYALPEVDVANHPVVFFDGMCGMCNSAVDFVMKRDRAGKFRFATLQGGLAKAELDDAFDGPQPDSLVLMDAAGVHVYSTGILRILRDLPAPWSCLSVGLIVPRPIRDAVYRFVAKHRYRVFGRKDACRMPTPEERDRIID
ncbi:MAG: DCC1-like thiol-disulfide oxidoreductase family protein [Planctomycetota bacterium]